MRQSTLLALALAAAFTAAASLPLRAQQAAAPAQLAPGEGADIVAATCSQCHALTAITQLREGKDAWRHEVDNMIEKGAQLSPDNVDVVVNYLATHYGPGSPFPGQGEPVPLAPGNGSNLVAANCGVCHSVARVTATKRSRTQWTNIVARMQYLGSPITSDQAKAIVDYLSTNYGSS